MHNILILYVKSQPSGIPIVISEKIMSLYRSRSCTGYVQALAGFNRYTGSKLPVPNGSPDIEHIKQALEQTRIERERGVNPPLAAPSPLVHDKSQPKRRTRPSLVESKVVYTQTKIVEVDAERLREHRIVAMAEHDSAAVVYKVLRTHVLQRMRTNGWQTLAITSPGEGNGKTVTAINLAISLAREVNQTVLLVDLDLRHPSIARYFVEGAIPGLSDYLMDDRTTSELLINPGIDRLVILPGHHSFTHSSEMLSSPKMIQLVEELKSRYPDRLILFDMPPVLASDDVVAFSPYLDAVMLVLEEGKTTKDELIRTYELLSDVKVIGTVLNQSEEASSGDGYY